MQEKEILRFCKKYLSYHNDGRFFWKKKPSMATKAGAVAGRTNSQGYHQISIKDRQFYAHRLAWLLHFKKLPSGNLDHINGIKTDNRIENLRELSIRENAHNRVEHRRGGLVGASFHKSSHKWQSNIQINGKSKYLGLFSSQKEANAAYMVEFNKIKDFER